MRMLLVALFVVGCGAVEAPEITMPALILSVSPACDIVGGELDSLDGLTFVSARQTDDTQARKESLNGYEYTYEGIATGMLHGGVAAYPRVPCKQTFVLVPTLADTCDVDPCDTP